MGGRGKSLAGLGRRCAQSGGRRLAAGDGFAPALGLGLDAVLFDLLRGVGTQMVQHFERDAGLDQRGAGLGPRSRKASGCPVSHMRAQCGRPPEIDTFLNRCTGSSLSRPRVHPADALNASAATPEEAQAPKLIAHTEELSHNLDTRRSGTSRARGHLC